MQPNSELERTLVLFNDDTQRFEPIQQLSLNAQSRLDGRPFLVSSGSHDYQYFPAESIPVARVQADLAHLMHPSEYEAYTCLVQGTRVEKGNVSLERGPDGRLVCGWKRDTPLLNYKQQQDLIAAGKMKPQEGLIQLRDFQTATPIAPFGATVEWNSYRKRWIMLVQRRVGEIWYTEGDTPLGPWVYSTRVVMHDRYDFYLPVQHPFFTQENGRLIYFEAKQSELGQTLAGTWNCKARDSDGSEFPFTLEFRVERGIVRGRVDQDEIPEGAFREDHIGFQIKSGDGTFRVVGRLEGGKLAGDWQEINSGKGGTWVGAADQSGMAWMKSQDVIPLYEYHSTDGSHVYSTEPKIPSQQLQRSADPICRVWRNPASLLSLDRDAKTVPE